MKRNVTGLQLLSEFETLLSDAGIYIYSVGKRAVGCLKKAFDKSRQGDGKSNSAAANCDEAAATQAP